MAIEIFIETIKDNVYITTAISKTAKKNLPRGMGHNDREYKMQLENEKNNLMMILVTRMKTDFVNPDKVLIQKYSEGKELIFVQKGECMFTLQETKMLKAQTKKQESKSLCRISKNEDEKGKKEQTLRAGRYFGEISLTYGCQRTSNVLAKKYCTIGILSKEDYFEVIKLVPQIAKEIKQGIYKYNDANVVFMKRALSKVPYFQYLHEE